MDINKLYSSKRTGQSNSTTEKRTDYQRDFDRLIFSSPFRRLQNKTQVFPLPGSTFVHNRLTHSLEVASVGRSLGKNTGSELVNKYNKQLTDESKQFYNYHLSEVVAAACLAHDIGNPAFGHSGEKAISHYFRNNSGLQSNFSEAEWTELINFEGNANALRVLTRQFNGRIEGGFGLTLTTLATILKYPCEAMAVSKHQKHTKKYGFFIQDKQVFDTIANEFEMIRESESPLSYKRHPFVYLLEAADDICYRIIDFEDATRLGILPYKEAESVLLALIHSLNGNAKEVKQTVAVLGDENEKIAYLRSKSIGGLTRRAGETFIQNWEAILKGTYNNTLIDELQSKVNELKTIESISLEKIYHHPTVIEIEIAGYNVLSEILNIFVPATLKGKHERTAMEKAALLLIPNQFGPITDSDTPYEKTMKILDVVSGMTDLYATEFYRKIKGIDIGKHK